MPLQIISWFVSVPCISLGSGGLHKCSTGFGQWSYFSRSDQTDWCSESRTIGIVCTHFLRMCRFACDQNTHFSFIIGRGRLQLVFFNCSCNDIVTCHQHRWLDTHLSSTARTIRRRDTSSTFLCDVCPITCYAFKRVRYANQHQHCQQVHLHALRLPHLPWSRQHQQV